MLTLVAKRGLGGMKEGGREGGPPGMSAMLLQRFRRPVSCCICTRRRKGGREGKREEATR